MKATNTRNTKFYDTLHMLSCEVGMTAFLVVVFLLQGSMALAAKGQLTGKELFQRYCAGCHGPEKQGDKTRGVPSLLDIQTKRSKKFVRNRILKGKGIMPPFTFLKKQERDAIVSFLFGKSEKPVTAQTVSPEALGRQLFLSNCAGCHRVRTTDPPPGGLPEKLPHPGEPAALAGVTKRFTNAEFFGILDLGPSFMPSFSHLSFSEKQSLWTFAKTLEGKGEAPGPTMMEMHPHGIPEVKLPPGVELEEPTSKTATLKALEDAIVEEIQNRKGQDGYFTVYDRKDKKTRTVLKLSLVEVHREKLSWVYRNTYFACADLKNVDGKMYDVDFFLDYENGKFRLTGVSVHKEEGKPRYQWITRNGRWIKAKP